QTSSALAVADPVAPPPSNAFELGKTKLNKKKGTATIAVSVPAAGDLTLTGKNVAPQKTSGRELLGSSSLRPVAAGTSELKVKAKGKAKRKLKSKGKVKVKATITFTPNGGAASVQSRSVKLVKRD